MRRLCISFEQLQTTPLTSHSRLETKGVLAGSRASYAGVCIKHAGTLGNIPRQNLFALRSLNSLASGPNFILEIFASRVSNRNINRFLAIVYGKAIYPLQGAETSISQRHRF